MSDKIFSMKFEHYEILLTMIALRTITHLLIGLTWVGDVVTQAIYFVFSGLFCISFFGVWKKRKWGLPLIATVSLLLGVSSLPQLSGLNELFQILFWDVFPMYLAYKLFKKEDS